MGITATNFINQAKAWLGSSEGDGKYEQIMNIFNSNHSGYQYDGEGCTEFACACAIAIGGEDRIGVANWCEGCVNAFKKKGLFKAKANATPIAGCFVFFDLNLDGVPDHTEVVTDVNGGYIYTIDGNDSHSVNTYKWKTTSNKIFGYGFPNWDSELVEPDSANVALWILDENKSCSTEWNMPTYALQVLINKKFNKYGYKLDEDGLYGPNTAKVVQDFNNYHDNASAGRICNKKTWEQMLWYAE